MSRNSRQQAAGSRQSFQCDAGFFSARCPLPAARSAFSVTELLIVIGILVIVLALSVPAFNLITGSRSVETAGNNIAAMLSRARAEAIGLQQMRGVFFYVDIKTGNVNVALVEQVDKPSGAAALDVDVYLDLTGDRDVMSLSKGISVQVIDDGGSSAAPNDRYIGFNNINATPGSAALPARAENRPLYGGVILFDARGQLTSKRYALRVKRFDSTAAADVYTPMGVLLYEPPDPTVTPPANHREVVPIDPTPPANATRVMKSQLGYVLFDLETFKNANEGSPFNDAVRDLQVESPAQSYGAHERAKENWIDQNATAWLINRYTGTLVKGE
jgi:Tfp pilus assembly protein FimT